MPLAADFDDIEHPFFDELHDVPFIDLAHAAQVTDAQDRGLIKNGAGYSLIVGW
jgi:hypothetical protein